MSDQEVMTLVNRLHDYGYYNLILIGLIFLFLITAIGLAFLLMILQQEQQENSKAENIAVSTSILSVMLFVACMLSQNHLEKSIHHQQKVLVQEVITKKSETWMDWKQDEKGNYHFDNSDHDIPTANKDIVVKSKNVTKYNLSPTAGSVPIAEVTTKNISKRFTKEQKEKIKKVLPEHSLDSSAEVAE